MDPLLYVAIAVILTVLIGLLTFLKKSSSADGTVQAGREDEAVRPGPRGEPAMVGGMRRRGVRGNRMQRRDDSDDEGEEEIGDDIVLPDGKIGAKKLRKLQEKEEKKRMREAELREREERKEREQQLEQLRKKEEAEEEAMEKAREEEERKRKEEEEKREYEEYLKMKEQFSVEEEGEEALSSEQTQSLLQEFINYIIEMKVVMLEDLAAHFKLRTQDAIDRIKELQNEGRLSGVIDDRGKFIHITKEEYESVAKFIKQRGRVSISELAESSNRLINLTPDNLDTHKKLVSEVSG